MKIKSISVILFVSLVILLFIGIQSCKDETVVEPPPPINQNPPGPVLISPANNATLLDFTPTLNWEDFTGAISYRIQLSLDANFSGIMVIDSSGLTSSQITVPQGKLTTASYYYWRVIAAISGGVSPWSAVWRFHIILQPPAAPNLISPPNGSTNLTFTPLLDWSDPPSAEFFRLQISTSPLFNAITFDTNRILVSQHQISQYVLFPNTQYYWRVNASNSGGVSTSPWSVVWNFSTMDGPMQNTISGRITFVDSNFVSLPYYYEVGAFDSWPPFNPPPYSDSLIITLIGNQYIADYEITRAPSNIYYVAVYTVVQLPFEMKILGIYGCDTVHVSYSNCPLNPTGVEIIQNWGVENINFLSWADTTQRIF